MLNSSLAVVGQRARREIISDPPGQVELIWQVGLPPFTRRGSAPPLLSPPIWHYVFLSSPPGSWSPFFFLPGWLRERGEVVIAPSNWQQYEHKGSKPGGAASFRPLLPPFLCPELLKGKTHSEFRTQFFSITSQEFLPPAPETPLPGREEGCFESSH